MTFLRVALMSLTLLLSPFVSPHHVVFEEIGEMAGALSYVHAVVPVNISGLTRSIYQFKEDVRNLETLYQQKRQPTRLGADEFFHRRIIDLFTNAAAEADAMASTIHSLRETLPPVPADGSHLHHEDEYRIRRGSPFAILGGVIGTLMGWFSQRRLNNLRDRGGDCH